MSANPQSLNLPYVHLNLRRNPFGELSTSEWTSLAIVDIETVTARLATPRYAVQFVGEKGYGKTTHLLSIRSRFSNAGYVHIPEGERAALPSGDLVLIDEAQRLTGWQRFQLFRSSVPLVLGTHRDFSKQLSRAGRDVETVDVGQGTTAQRLHLLLNARIARFRRGDGPVPNVTLATSEFLIRTFDRNIRAMLQEMYNRFQTLNKVADV